MKFYELCKKHGFLTTPLFPKIKTPGTIRHNRPVHTLVGRWLGFAAKPQIPMASPTPHSRRSLQHPPSGSSTLRMPAQF